MMDFPTKAEYLRSRRHYDIDGYRVEISCLGVERVLRDADGEWWAVSPRTSEYRAVMDKFDAWLRKEGRDGYSA